MQRRQQAGALQQQQHLDADESAENKYFAMGKIDELQHPIDHGVAQGDERVHETQHDAVEQNLGENFQRDFQAVVNPSGTAC